MNLVSDDLFDYRAISEAYGLSYSQVSREVSEGRLRVIQLGRRKVASGADIAAWLEVKREQSATRRLLRGSRQDQKPPKRERRKRPSEYKPQAGRDLLEALGLETKK